METKVEPKVKNMNLNIETNEQHSVGDVVEGPVITVDRSTTYIDLSPYGTGIIRGREFIAAKDILRNIKIGDTISAKIINLETSNGYIELSLKEARKAYIWEEAETSKESGKIYEVIVKNANFGGLIIEWNGIRGFLPASQLSEANYPKIINGNKEGVLTELKKFIDKKLMVVIESTNKKDDMLIFSEHKNGENSEKIDKNEEKSLVEYKVGDIKNGIVTGLVDFGVFTTIDKKIEGLVHISEMHWGLVDDPRKFYNIGDQVQVKIIAIDENNKYSFSFKELQKNPWIEIENKYKVNDVVSGVVIKYSQFGAFASIEAGVSGLVHISNFNDDEDLRNRLGIGKTHEFVITTLDPANQKLTLVPKDIHDLKAKKIISILQ